MTKVTSVRDGPSFSQVGDKIFLTNSCEEVTGGSLQSLAWEDATLTLGTRSGRHGVRDQLTTFSMSDIRRIELEVDDSNVNGALYGAAAGAGVMFGLLAASDCPFDSCVGILFAGTALLGALPGAVIGTVVDASTKERRLVFDTTRHESTLNLRVVPILTRDRKGLAVSLSF